MRAPRIDKWQKFIIYDNLELKIGTTDIVYVTGDSGSGKSGLLKALEKDIRQDWGLTFSWSRLALFTYSF